MMDDVDQTEMPTVEVDWDLENWLLDAGEKAERKSIAGVLLTPIELLIREFWIFDIETQNGGVSQYFCNRELDQWQRLRSAWLPDFVPSLGSILTEVDRVITGAIDSYSATLDASPDIEDFYEAHRLDVLSELRRFADN